MTRIEKLTKALEAHADGAFEAPAPDENQFGFLRAAIAAGHLPDGNLRSYATVLRSMVGSPAEEPEHEPFPTTVRKYTRRWALTEGEDGERHYIFYHRTPFTLPERGYEDLKRAYSNRPFGLGWTINKCCKYFGIGRSEFQFIRQQMGWTHDQDEFTTEEHLELSTNQLLDDREQRSRWLLEQEQNRREVKEAFDKAQKYDMALGRYLGLKFDQYEVRHVFGRSGASLAVFPMPDFHFEEEQDARARVEQACSIMDDASSASDRILLVFQGDWFNFDTYGRTTTHGTLVGAEYAEFMVRNAYAAAYAIVQKAFELFVHVDFLIVAGNHDRMQTFGFSVWLEQQFGRTPDFLDGPPSMELACYRYGSTQLLFEHGDGARGNLDRIIAKAAGIYGVLPGIRRYLYTGHLHHAKFVDVGGVLCFQLPAPKLRDTKKPRRGWEEKQCYESQHGMRIDLYSSEMGLVETMWRLQ